MTRVYHGRGLPPLLKVYTAFGACYDKRLQLDLGNGVAKHATSDAPSVLLLPAF